MLYYFYAVAVTSALHTLLPFSGNVCSPKVTWMKYHEITFWRNVFWVREGTKTKYDYLFFCLGFYSCSQMLLAWWRGWLQNGARSKSCLKCSPFVGSATKWFWSYFYSFYYKSEFVSFHLLPLLAWAEMYPASRSEGEMGSLNSCFSDWLQFSTVQAEFFQVFSHEGWHPLHAGRWRGGQMDAAENVHSWDRKRERERENEARKKKSIYRLSLEGQRVCVRMEGLCAAYVYGTWSFPQRRRFSAVNRSSLFEVSRTLKVQHQTGSIEEGLMRIYWKYLLSDFGVWKQAQTCTRQRVYLSIPLHKLQVSTDFLRKPKDVQGSCRVGFPFQSMRPCKTFFETFSEWWEVSGFLFVNMVFSSGEGPRCQDQTTALLLK